MGRLLKTMTSGALLLGAAVMLAGCAGGPFAETGPKETQGMLAGSMSGALIGSALAGGPPGAQAAAIIAGAAIGGLVGNRIGAAMDDEDRQLAYEAQMDALETGSSGAPIVWRNRHSGRHGTIVPGPSYNQRGSRCRSYTHTVYLETKPQTMRGTACRDLDGTWTAVN